MSSTTGNNYFTKSMNSIIEIDDGAGTVISDGVIQCNTFSANDLVVNNLNSGSITNSGVITTSYLNIKNGGFQFSGDTSTYSEQYINTNTNIYRYILYPPINKALWTINGNNTFTLDDTKATIPTIETTTLSGNNIMSNFATITNLGSTTGNITTMNSNNIISNNATITNLNSTTGNITTINSTNISSNGATITNLNSTTGNITTINTNNFTTQSIEPKIISSNVSLFTTATNNLNIGGNNAINIGKTGNFNTEITNLSGFGPCVKFHSSTLNYNDYDSRIISTLGSSTSGEGNLTFNAKAVNFLNQSSNSPEFYLGFDRFYFKPWTTYYSATYTATTSHSNFINFPTGSTCPSGPSGAVVSYRSTIIGNSMYVNFSYYQPSAGGFVGTTGTYQYKIPLPSGYIFDTTDLISSGITTPYGTRFGSGCMKIVGSTSTVTVGIFWTQQNSTNGLMLFEEAGSNAFNYTPQAQSNGRYSYASTGVMTVKFDAIIPIST